MEDNSTSNSMSFLGHIGILRKHIFRAFLAIAIAAIVIFIKINYITTHIIFGPTRNDFITFRLINKFSSKGPIISMPEHFPIQVRKVFEQLNASFSIALLGGFIVAFPYIIYELWKFIAPGLKESEKKNSVLFFISTYSLFIIGCLFGYLLVMPLALHFGYFYSISDAIQVNIDLNDYISILLKSVLGMGLVFLFPVITYVLTSVDMLSSSFLKTYRRHAIIVALVISSLVTPGDLLSMLIAAVPLYLLYEFSILLSIIVEKKRAND